MPIEIKQIDYNKIISIRHQVMWPNKPLEYVKLVNDKRGKHVGLSIDKKLVSVISIFENKNKIQFRKFATLHEYQGNGYGTKLLNYIMEETKKQKFTTIWCNARIDKIDFYLKFGLKTTNNRFKKGGIDYIIMEKNFASTDC